MLPEGSEKMYVTDVVPTLNVSPGECVLDISVTDPELSVASHSGNVTLAAPPVFTGMNRVTSSPHVHTGGSVSEIEHTFLDVVS